MAPSMVIAVMKAISAIISGSIGIGMITLLIPRINRMLKMHEPSTLPMTIPFSPFLRAVIEVTSSGRDVPIATTVRPIRASLKPKNEAISLAPSTTKLEPMISRCFWNG